MRKKEKIEPGDIFCIEIDNSYKCYFLYIGDDRTNRDSRVIKVFKTRYLINQQVDINDIVSQEMAFWTNAFLAGGIGTGEGYWYKIGRVNIANFNDTDSYNFISHTRPKENIPDKLYKPEENACWWIWKMNEEASQIFPVPYDITDKLEDNESHTADEVIDRIKTGYYKTKSPVYDVIKRKPLPGVQSYLKTQCVPEIVYYHFDGEDLARQITISKTDGSVKINKLKGRIKFWDRNWEPYEFIPRQQFEYAWMKYHPMNPINAISGLASNLFKS